jgi:UDP-N-acetylglucosamine acyltransferase
MSQSSVTIHPTALVDPAAKIGPGTTIGAYSIIGPSVVIGRDNVIGPHVVIEGITKIGDGNRVFQFASVGAQPQDLKYRGEPSELIIGNKNIIRECATLQPGTTGGGMVTKVGDSNLFMANTHVGHDTIVGSRCVFANSCALAGHVTIGNGVIVGGLSGIHQFVKIGDVAMIGAGAMVSQDIPPYCIAQGDRATIHGLNRIGLERNGGTREDLSVLRKIYRTVFTPTSPEVVGKTFKERVVVARTIAGSNQRAVEFVAFLEGSERGVCSHHGSRGAGAEED